MAFQVFDVIQHILFQRQAKETSVSLLNNLGFT